MFSKVIEYLEISNARMNTEYSKTKNENKNKVQNIRTEVWKHKIIKCLKIQIQGL